MRAGKLRHSVKAGLSRQKCPPARKRQVCLPILSLCGLTLLTACATPPKQVVVRPTEIFLSQDLIRACPRTDRPGLSDTPMALMSKDALEAEVKGATASSV